MKIERWKEYYTKSGKMVFCARLSKDMNLMTSGLLDFLVDDNGVCSNEELSLTGPTGNSYDYLADYAPDGRLLREAREAREALASKKT